MSSMSDKLSASLRKAKAQSESETKPAEVAAPRTPPARKPPAKRAAKPRTASKTGAPRRTTAAAKTAAAQQPPAPAASHGELFPERVWPD